MSENPMSVEIVVSCDAHVIRPGDTVILRVDQTVTPDQARFVAETLKDKLPGVEVLIVGAVAGIDVYRPTTESDIG